MSAMTHHSEERDIRGARAVRDGESRRNVMTERTWIVPSLAFVAIWACVALGASPAWAQEVPCNNTTEFPCGYQIEQLSLQKAPALFQFQSRVAQAKLPLGDATFQTVVVKLLRGSDVLCIEQIPNVEVQGSVLNLTIGQNMSCELAEVIAENANLAFQICLGGPANCLKPIELSTTPYAIKATYASLAQQAQRANVAGQASYAHRATADRDMFLRKKLGAGYFDFYTHPGKDATELYDGAAYQPYEDGGFIQWTPVRDTQALRMHIVGKDQGTDQLRRLDELVLASRLTRATGDLLVQPDADGQGLVVTAQGLHVVGGSDIAGTLLVTEDVTAESTLDVLGHAQVLQTLTVAQQATVTAGGLHVTGASDIAGELLVTGGLRVQSGMEVTGDCDVDGLLTVTEAQVNVGLVVDGTGTIATLSAGEATIDGLLTATQATVTGAATVGGALDVLGALGVGGPTVFTGHVTFEGGVTEPAGAADMRYVLAEGEQRDLTFGGLLAMNAGAVLGGDLDVGGHQLLNFRFQAAGGPPVPCEAPTEGFFYLDTVEQAVMICVGGEYKKLGGDECGDGYFEPTEQCDDGNLTPGDGCSAACLLELGWLCTDMHVQPTTCETVCGDGWIRDAEQCDDGDTEPGDGCDDQCQIVDPWTCSGEPSVCLTVCGDGVIGNEEECDDGDLDPDDGCSPECVVEEGWGCEGEPSVCEPPCGDGTIGSSEECDDGDKDDGDGCSSECKIETGGWSCEGEPSVCFKPGSQTFGPHVNCATHTFTVPAGVHKITVELWGAEGSETGGVENNGGRGGYVKGDLAVEPGAVYWVGVGWQGGDVSGKNSFGGTFCAWSGGGLSALSPSYLSMSTLPADVLLVAGGGGGGGGHSDCDGGAGGWPNGGSGDKAYGSSAPGGKGGTQTAGGDGGYLQPISGTSGEPGTFGFGGASGGGATFGMGGGGNGWYGGGGGSKTDSSQLAGGGGGSSYYDSTAITNFSSQNGVRTGNGQAKISW